MPTLTNNALDKNIENYIVVFENVLTDAFCDGVLAEFSHADEWNSALVGTQATVDRNIRNADAISLSTPSVVQKNPKCREIIEETFYRACGGVLRRYQTTFPFCRVVEGMGFELLRYSAGGYYKTHTDSFKKVPRALACSFALNDDFAGGDWSFFCGDKKIRPPKGSVVVFPSNFLFPHEITEVISGTRYSVVTWMI
ncbi:hypothetical protein [Polaromonas sp. CG9_12]|nr:hypothetical protein [Polaromonas sp. CG9_12]